MVRSGCGRAREGSEPDAENSWRIIRASGRSWPMPPWFIWRGANGSRRSSLSIGETSRFIEQAAGVPSAFFRNCSILGRGNFNLSEDLYGIRTRLIAALIPGGVSLQGGISDGESEPLPRVVAETSPTVSGTRGTTPVLLFPLWWGCSRNGSEARDTVRQIRRAAPEMGPSP